MRDQLGAGSLLPNADLLPNASRSARVAVSRRQVLVLSAAALASTQLGRSTALADDIEAHGISAFGDLKYPADFRHFEYVNPNAPKGGLFSQIGPGRHLNQNLLTFNSLNSYILKGD